MAGWVVLTYDNDGYEMFESIGVSRLEIAKAGPPEVRVLDQSAVISVEWFDEEPKPKGKPLAEAIEAEEEKAAKEEEKQLAAQQKEAEKAEKAAK